MWNEGYVSVENAGVSIGESAVGLRQILNSALNARLNSVNKLTLQV